MKKKTAPKKSATKKSAKKTPARKTNRKKPTLKKSGAPQVGGTKSTLTFLTESLPAFTVGRVKKTRIQAVGGTQPYSFGITQGTLPTGLNLNYLGTLFGKPTQSGSTTIFVKVIDFVGSHLTQAFDLEVVDA
jgi:hypothetical protein